jgi:hypothetical protein
MFLDNLYTIQENEIEVERHLQLAFISFSTIVKPLVLTVCKYKYENINLHTGWCELFF